MTEIQKEKLEQYFKPIYIIVFEIFVEGELFPRLWRWPLYNKQTNYKEAMQYWDTDDTVKQIRGLNENKALQESGMSANSGRGERLLHETHRIARRKASNLYTAQVFLSVARPVQHKRVENKEQSILAEIPSVLHLRKAFQNHRPHHASPREP